jgi:hypothetical protein
MFSGMAASGQIKDSIGFFGNFTLGMVLALAAMLYTIFILKVKDVFRTAMLYTIFILKVKDVFRTLVFQRVAFFSHPEWVLFYSEPE